MSAQEGALGVLSKVKMPPLLGGLLGGIKTPNITVDERKRQAETERENFNQFVSLKIKELGAEIKEDDKTLIEETCLPIAGEIFGAKIFLAFVKRMDKVTSKEEFCVESRLKGNNGKYQLLERMFFEEGLAKATITYYNLSSDYVSYITKEPVTFNGFDSKERTDYVTPQRLQKLISSI